MKSINCKQIYRYNKLHKSNNLFVNQHPSHQKKKRKTPEREKGQGTNPQHGRRHLHHNVKNFEGTVTLCCLHAKKVRLPVLWMLIEDMRLLNQK